MLISKIPAWASALLLLTAIYFAFVTVASRPPEKPARGCDSPVSDGAVLPMGGMAAGSTLYKQPSSCSRYMAGKLTIE